MSAGPLIERLSGVRPLGAGRWMARCPAHEDRRASLSVRELNDGRVLVHDFAGCAVADVLGAVGLTFSDLFPERATDHRARPQRPVFDARAALRALANELTVVALYAADLRSGRGSNQRDHERFLLACSRIIEAREYANA